ncbi:energy-coupling factor transporter transmembrane component T [Streptomyces melanogenes]|uniref:energy-coupling factor transporter transmembrane component T n=1 Tax=Streptomyces melanogenes TaxID=67326 RepID=UPI001995839D|nr:energy-coupling factor transporter transmembrane component T [Streptomyces melanogenes]GGP39805.1 cobalt ABC transporter permease [Streptomyces melanogenes]
MPTNDEPPQQGTANTPAAPPATGGTPTHFAQPPTASTPVGEPAASGVPTHDPQPPTASTPHKKARGAGGKTGPAAGQPHPRRPRAERRRTPYTTRSNALHPGAWWLWAIGLATAASRTTNPLLLALLVAVAGYVVAARRTDAPWARSYTAFVKLGLAVVAIRLVFNVALGSPIPGTHTLLTLPEAPLPDWAKGIRIGGRVTAEGMLFALYDGARLATLLICVGAANALANPARLLKSLPGALYEAGVAVVVAMTFAPNMVADVARLRTVRRLRGRPTGGIKAILQIGLPVLEGALERSVAVAASMDARGYGRTAHVPPAVRHTTTVLTLGGLLGVCAGTYGLLAAEGARYGLPVLLTGLAAALAGLRLGGRRSVRTRYRPDRWGARAWLVAGSGAAVAAAMIWAGTYAPDALHPGVVPLTAPELPLWPALATLLGLLPAFVTPAPQTPQESK